MNVKTYLTAAALAAVMITVAGGSAHAQQEQAMVTACENWNSIGYKVKGASFACTPYADGVWITMQDPISGITILPTD